MSPYSDDINTPITYSPSYDLSNDVFLFSFFFTVLHSLYMYIDTLTPHSDGNTAIQPIL